MTPGKTTVQHLQDYLSRQASNDAGYQFNCDLKKFKIQINLKEFDKFSFIAKSLRVESSDNLQSGSDILRNQADFLKANLTYLLEILKVFEIDNPHSKAQLRSHVPEEDDASISYFEIMITKCRSITLERFIFDKNNKQRKLVSFHLSNKALERTIDDFVKTIELAQ